MTIDDTAYTLLLHWMTERERARLAKEAGSPRPWTTDHVINEWRFCNVNRCDDRETRWIFKHVIKAHAASPVLWFNLAIARFINWAPTLSCLGYFDDWEEERFISEISALQAHKEKVYTGAYMIPAGPAGTEKHVYLARAVFGKLWSLRAQAPTQNACSAWDVFLRQAPLMGDFLRNQIITDMRYSHHLVSAIDWETYILPGPGTQRGLNRLHTLPLKHKWKAEEASQALQALRTRIVEQDPNWASTLRDINNLSNCMCEYDIYCRVLNNEGTPRARYQPSTGTMP